jgi:Flp pilus assembly pilin Flp
MEFGLVVGFIKLFYIHYVITFDSSLLHAYTSVQSQNYPAVA